jgi:hypothetical protein
VFAGKLAWSTCWGVHHFLSGSTPFLVGEYTISCRGVHHFLSGSTPSLAGEYTITCRGVHHPLLGSTPLLVGEYTTSYRRNFARFAGNFVVMSLLKRSMFARQYTIFLAWPQRGKARPHGNLQGRWRVPRLGAFKPRLDARKEEIRRRDHLLAVALQRIPELLMPGPDPEPRESPKRSPRTPGLSRPATGTLWRPRCGGRSWWRRPVGG